MIEETSFNTLIDEQKSISKKRVAQSMEQASTATPTPVMKAPKENITTSTFKSEEEILKGIKANPYPEAIHQTVIDPTGKAAKTKPTTKQKTKSTSDNTVSPDIIDLVENSNGLKVSTIAKQANRIAEPQAEEVDIKLH